MAICSKDGRLLGSIFFFKPQGYIDGYEIGYRIFRPDERGKGLMTEALRIFSSYLFAIKPVNRLQLLVAEGNTGSWKVAEKCGFKKEGQLRNAMFIKGTYHDMRIYSLLRSEAPAFDEVVTK